MRLVRLSHLSALAAALVAVVFLPSPAEAAVRTSTGVRCTIVGTAHADRLTGTRGRDVICGRGGNDRISGLRGNDLIDGGAGNDAILGGTGNDRLLGGAGKDTLSGQDGADLVRGGGGNDALHGNAGNDVVIGDDGGDVLAGDAGNDVVAGSAGDDDLNGGAGTDEVDGGGGFNVCDVPGSASDQQVRCAIDTAKPEVGAVTVSATSVNVSNSPARMTVRARVIDDTGVKTVQMGQMAELVSGTSRDGVWQATIYVPRYVAPGSRDVDVFVKDRVGRTAQAWRQNMFTVTNSVVDREMPTLRSLTLSTSSVDVRTAAKTITATARITDDLAGVEIAYLCPARKFAAGFGQAAACTYMTKSSGSTTNGTWKAAVTIPRGAPSGTWNFQVWVEDASGSYANDFWFGPDEWAAMGPQDEPRYKAIPNGGGAFAVLGAPGDTHAPTLTSLTLTPSPLDTSSGAKLVTATIAATDVEGITNAGLSIGGHPDGGSEFDDIEIAWVHEFALDSGTTKNGVWRATFVVPGGTPSGTYSIQVSLSDTSHSASWVSPDMGWAGYPFLTNELAPTGTYFVIANSG